MFLCSSFPLGFDPVGTSEPPDGIPTHGDTFHLVKLLGKMGIVEVCIGLTGQLNDP